MELIQELVLEHKGYVSEVAYDNEAKVLHARVFCAGLSGRGVSQASKSTWNSLTPLCLSYLMVHERRPLNRTDSDTPERTPARLLKPKLYRRQEGSCNGSCGDDGTGRELPINFIDIDHTQSKSNDGADPDAPKQLLCRTRNMSKGNRTMRYLAQNALAD